MKKLCAKCDLPVAFKMLPSGRWCPTNPDGSDHFDLCSKVRFERDASWKYPEQKALALHAAKLLGSDPDRSQPWFAGKTPWNEFAPSHCRCGTEFAVTESDCTVTLFCRPCGEVRIETSMGR